MAYISDENPNACGEEIELIARTNTAVTAAADAGLDEGFSYNKDAGMMQCPSGELAMRVEKRAAKNGELKEVHGLRRADSTKKTPARKVGVFQCPRYYAISSYLSWLLKCLHPA